jgi:hypothetical protein
MIEEISSLKNKHIENKYIRIIFDMIIIYIKKMNLFDKFWTIWFIRLKKHKPTKE